MNIAVVGTGYVGLVTGTCFAELGNDVTCIDIDQKKVNRMKEGEIPIYEPGLEDYFKRNIDEGRLRFSTDLKDVLGSVAIFLALPTPPGEGGEADLSYILGVAEELGKILTQDTVIVDKSTVPVGTGVRVQEKAGKNGHVVSNPEFLREGSAVDDFMKPDRIIVGTNSTFALKIMTRLYRPLVRREPEKLIFTDTASAEMIKYANNAFLAMKITFMNELAPLCEATGADIDNVRRGIGSDCRIGSAFLYPGPGYGGSCFPKDTLALAATAKNHNLKLSLVEATIDANEKHKRSIPEKILNYFDGDIKGKKFALWGLAFKDNTDDVRESPALTMINALTSKGAKVVAFDPQAIETTRKEINRIGGNELLLFAQDEYSALEGADALVIATNWKEFFTPDFNRIKEGLKAPVIFDGRNLYDLETMEDEKFHYESIGRKVVSSNE